MKRLRNNDYYLDLLKREHPVIFGDYQAGKYPTVEKARIAAGIKTKRTPLQELLNAWKKASTAERNAFQHVVGGHVPGTAVVAPAPAASAPFSIGRRLEPGAIKAFNDIKHKRSLSVGEIMKELGRKPLDQSLSMALQRGTKLQQDLIDDLEAWTKDQETEPAR